MILSLFVAVLFVPCAYGRSDLSEAEARKELKIVVDTLLRNHPDPFHITTKKEFDRQVNRLQRRQGAVSVTRQYFELSQLLSLMFDVHTQLHVTGQTPGFRTTFPLRFKIFPTGLYVIAGSREYRDLIGKRVVSIAGKDTASVIDRLSRYATADSIVRKKVTTEMFFYLPETYDYFGLKTTDGRISMVIENSKGDRENAELSKTWDKSLDELSWDSLNPFVPDTFITVQEVLGTQKPYYLQNLKDNYWFGFLDKPEKYFYLQINFPFKNEGGPLPTEFHLNWSRRLWESKAEVLIIDLRNNPGGSISLGNPIPGILSTLASEHPTLRGVSVLIGTDTVSAGVALSAQLEDAIAPVFIGEPTGSAPNIFLQAGKIELPYSKLRFEYSTDKYIITREADKRRYLAPDVPMAISFEDYSQGRDPLIEFAKTVDKKMSKMYYGSASLYQPWFRDSQKKVYK